MERDEEGGAGAGLDFLGEGEGAGEGEWFRRRCGEAKGESDGVSFCANFGDGAFGSLADGAIGEETAADEKYASRSSSSTSFMSSANGFISTSASPLRERVNSIKTII